MRLTVAMATLFLWASLVGAEGAEPTAANDALSLRLPPEVLPVMATWGWGDAEFEPDGYRRMLDFYRDHSAYDVIVTTLRVASREITDREVHDQIKKAAAYARRQGTALAMDLDPRLARSEFRRLYPDECQEMLRLREVDLGEAGTVALTIQSAMPEDHYTSHTTPYIPLSGRLVRVYSYVAGPEGIEPETLQDITATSCKLKAATEKEVSIEILRDGVTAGQKACAIVSFTHFAADVFAPHLLEFQRKIIEQYADVELAGVMKDEWGFPPTYDGCPAKNDFWYSKSRAAAYAARTGGRDLVRDCLLMYLGERGREKERQAAVNHFMEMSRQRNAAIENDYYRATKEVFGPKAFVGTHPTWWAYPDLREFKKNGLHWWVTKRDLAQTDEVTPYCVRTSLAKKCGSPVWYNMYYSETMDDYRRELWSAALGGGRVNYHPLFPALGEPVERRYTGLLHGELMRGDCRVRLLNFISKAPLDCPVAVVFGHACAMNWAGPAYDDAGMAVTDQLWRTGFPADLIPSSEIGERALQVDDDGYVRYGPQRYAAVILYHPEFERPEAAAFFQQAAGGQTVLYRVGDWTTDFDGNAFDGTAALPSGMAGYVDSSACAAEVIARLRERRIPSQTPAQAATLRYDRQLYTPPQSGHCRLIDGTQIFVAGQERVSGDPIQGTFDVEEQEVTIDAVGMAAVRFDEHGKLDAFAAGGLKHFRVADVSISLERRADIALWRDQQGTLRGVLQDWQGPIPPCLTTITQKWLRLSVPTPMP